MLNGFFYDAFMFPLETFAGLSACRNHLIPMARGRVLEAGPGTGVNASRYRAELVESVTLVSPDSGGAERLLARYRNAGMDAEFIEGDVQALPFGDAVFDTVVATLLFCSVPDPAAGLRELRRVLKPDGKYLFMEHVRPAGPRSAGLADFFTPAWRRIAGGCHLNRDTESAIREAGFVIDHSCDRAKGVFVGGISVISRA